MTANHRWIPALGALALAAAAQAGAPCHLANRSGADWQILIPPYVFVPGSVTLTEVVPETGLSTGRGLTVSYDLPAYQVNAPITVRHGRDLRIQADHQSGRTSVLLVLQPEGGATGAGVAGRFTCTFQYASSTTGEAPVATLAEQFCSPGFMLPFRIRQEGDDRLVLEPPAEAPKAAGPGAGCGCTIL